MLCCTDKKSYHSGTLSLIEGDLEICEGDAPYVNSAVFITLGSKDHTLQIHDCTIQQLPIEGLYMIQESRWNRLYR